MSTYRRLLGYLAPYRGRLALAIAAMAILAATTGIYPLALDLLTTYVVEGGGGTSRQLQPALDHLAGAFAFFGIALDGAELRAAAQTHLFTLFAVVVVLKVASHAVRFYQMGMIAQWVTRDLRADLFRAVLRQSAGYFGDQSTGFLVSRVINDVAQVERAATYAVPVLVGDVLKVVALATMCAVTYPRLSLVALIVAPLALFPIVRFGKLIKLYARQGQEELGGLTNRVTETLGGIRVVQAYGGEDHEAARFGAASEAYAAAMKRGIVIRAIQTPAMELIGVLALLLTLGYTVGGLAPNATRPGEVIGFLLVLVLLYEPLKAIGRLNSFIVPGVVSADRVFEVIDRAPEIADRPGAKPIASTPRVVAYEKVGFSYRNGGTLVLSELDLELPRGKLIALAGPSGGGKSTVAALLPRFFEPSEGRITIDGVDIRDLTLASLRENIALVAQETYLFNDTLRANIAYGRPSATMEEIERAARQAHAHEFISALPRGYETICGERGVALSGGQRQRIAIARAFLRNAPILVLDEATSALDGESERELQLALDALIENRAALVIAHRLSTIRRADEILVLDRGKVVERGTHDQLLARGQVYTRLTSDDRAP